MSIWADQACIGNKRAIYGSGTETERGYVVSPSHAGAYPSRDDLPAVVMVAHLPAWVVPGHQGSVDEDPVGPWIRLRVVVEASTGRADHENSWLEVALDRHAATALHFDLGQWLAAPTAKPLT